MLRNSALEFFSHLEPEETLDTPLQMDLGQSLALGDIRENFTVVLKSL